MQANSCLFFQVFEFLITVASCWYVTKCYDQFNGLDWSLLVKHLELEDKHNSWLYCSTNPFELETRVTADDAKAKHMSQVQKN